MAVNQTYRTYAQVEGQIDARGYATRSELAASSSVGFKGGATLLTIPDEDAGPQSWQATESGVYTNFGGLDVDLSDGVTFLNFDGVTWRTSTTPIDTSNLATKNDIDLIYQTEGIKSVQKILLDDGLYIGDPSGNYWFFSNKNGTTYVGQVTREEFDSLAANPVLDQVLSVENDAFILGDSSGNYWFKSTPLETDYVGKLKVSDVLTLIGSNASEVYLDSDLIQVIAYGQSLSVGGTGSGTAIDMYNTISFDGTVLTNYDPDDTVARDNYYDGGLTAMPSSGTESMKCIGRVLGQRIESLNGIAKEDQEFEILVNAPGASGISYASCADKLGDYYRRLIESVEKAQDFSISSGKSFSVPAICWIQGENSADKAKSKATVISELTSLFTELNTDIKAVTGQEMDVQFFVYQVASFLNNAPATVEMPLAHLELAETVENIHFGTAMYHYPYSDALHLTSIGYRIMASTFGAQIYNGVVLREKRGPIIPTGFHVQESSTGQFLLSVKMYVPVSPLVFDTDFYVAQTNMGFSIKNGSSSEIITSVSLKHGNTINILCSEDPTGFNLEYAIGGAVSGGNLRDSQGDSLTTNYGGVEYRVDNWAPIFRKTITT